VRVNSLGYGVFCLKDAEGFLSLNDTLGFECDHVEADRLTQGAALSNGDNITIFDRECRRAVDRNVGVTLFETTVLGNVVQVVPSDNDGALHFGGNDETLEDASANGNVSGEGALFVDKARFNGGGGCLDAESDRLDEAHGFLALLIAHGAFAGDENGILLLVSLFVLIALYVFLGNASHDCCSTAMVCQWTTMKTTKSNN
jgi:hypothetical protein